MTGTGRESGQGWGGSVAEPGAEKPLMICIGTEQFHPPNIYVPFPCFKN